MSSSDARKRRTSAETREHVLEVARRLFYWNGIRAVGVDRIAAEAGVAPMTLYRLFPSKDDLVTAYVDRTEDDYREWFAKATQADGRSPRDRILALFDELLAQTQPHVSRGCPFLMTLAEYPQSEAGCHRHAVDLKKWTHARMLELVDQLAESQTVDDPAGLADHLILIMEGVYASVQALGAQGPARRARAIAERLLTPEGGTCPTR
ncbi:TetR/AcrR family transcriptional regulator [Microbispora sp. ATCC PTA-5024]|uniref:TetR/AcrR family transcriptional regulator n=1 Tax=Microbispora sp. ATCC PTA-5024 TaxID=316330 RepID=UPI00056810F1|nr:TetR/AcrR family transcriptional regulator [Microbispora sp. ATCC PTA-5024]